MSRPARCERLRSFMASGTTRVVLSILILVSLLDVPVIEQLRLAFFAVFAAEIVIRVILLIVPSHRHGEPPRSVWSELPFLLLDTVATLSFLDLRFVDARYLRIFRLSRLFLLVGYWRPFLSDLVRIAFHRQRRHQIGFVVLAILLGTLAAAVVVNVAAPRAIDYDESGEIDAEDESLPAQAWWAFRQVQDPGNLVRKPEHAGVVVVSLALTVAGVFLLSFLIAVGTTVVDELLLLGRQRRVGLSGHVVIIGDGPHVRFLLQELLSSGGKQLHAPRLVLFGTQSERPADLHERPFARLEYRHGDASSPDELIRADVDRAALVILLSDDVGGDELLVSRVLAVRQLNPRCRIVADVLTPRNEVAVRAAGGPGTEAVLSRRFVGSFLARELLFPGLDAVLRELLTARGQELYLAPWPDGEARTVPPLARRAGACLSRQGVLPVGLARRVEGGAEPGSSLLLNPPMDEEVAGVDGVLVLARSAREARALAADLAAGRCEEAEPAPPASIPELAPTPELGRLARVLVCGFRHEIGALIEELAHQRPGIEICSLVAPGHGAEVRRGLLDRPVHASGGHFTEAGPDAVDFLTDDRRLARVTIAEGDPSSDRDLAAVFDGGRLVDEVDAMLFVADPRWGADPDAKSALVILKLFGHLSAEGAEPPAAFRVIGEIQEEGKGDLLEHRFSPLATDSAGHRVVDRFTLVSTEKLRHYLLAQTVFVPGIARAYAELLQERGEDLLKLVPSGAPQAGRRHSFRALVEALAPRRLIPVAVELVTDEGTVVAVNPAPSDRGGEFLEEDLCGVYCLGETNRLD